jgi:hypothetical protein
MSTDTTTPAEGQAPGAIHPDTELNALKHLVGALTDQVADLHRVSHGHEHVLVAHDNKLGELEEPDLLAVLVRGAAWAAGATVVSFGLQYLVNRYQESQARPAHVTPRHAAVLL